MACIGAETVEEPIQSRVEKCCERIFSHCSQPCIKPPKIDPALAPSVERSRLAYQNVTESTPNLIKCIAMSADDDHCKNTKHLEDRAIDVSKWQGEIESLIRKFREEITLTDALRLRVQHALKVLLTAEGINTECKTRRNSRIGHDFIPDCVDAALAEETRFCEQVRNELTNFLADIGSQLDTNKTCKIQLEFDWSDKNESHRLETINIGLRKKGPISFFPGATRLQENQSTPEHWLHYTKEQICQGCALLKRSFCLRKNAEEALAKYAADLRNLADSVELNLQDNIALTQQALQEAEEELKRVLTEITNAETLKPKLKLMAREVDLNLKVAQTRLTHRAARPRNENTRDIIQADLICEVQHLNQDGMDLKAKMDEATETLRKLYQSRRLLEDTISVKRKSLYIDRERCLFYRSKFPDCTHLAGFN